MRVYFGEKMSDSVPNENLFLRSSVSGSVEFLVSEGSDFLLLLTFRRENMSNTATFLPPAALPRGFLTSRWRGGPWARGFNITGEARGHDQFKLDWPKLPVHSPSFLDRKFENSLGPNSRKLSELRSNLNRSHRSLFCGLKRSARARPGGLSTVNGPIFSKFQCTNTANPLSTPNGLP